MNAPCPVEPGLPGSTMDVKAIGPARPGSDN